MNHDERAFLDGLVAELVRVAGSEHEAWLTLAGLAGRAYQHAHAQMRAIEDAPWWERSKSPAPAGFLGALADVDAGVEHWGYTCTVCGVATVRPASIGDPDGPCPSCSARSRQCPACQRWASHLPECPLPARD